MSLLWPNVHITGKEKKSEVVEPPRAKKNGNVKKYKVTRSGFTESCLGAPENYVGGCNSGNTRLSCQPNLREHGS